MKKMIIMVIALGLSISSFAQNGGGLFNRGSEEEGCYGVFGYHNSMYRGGPLPLLPYQHDLETDQPAPLGEGIALLIGFGAAYALVRKKKLTSES